MQRASDQAPADNQVGAVLASLAGVGLMVRVDSPGGRQPVYYQRIDSPLWELVAKLCDEVADKARGGPGR